MARPRRAETIQGAGREATGVAKAPPGDPGRQPPNPGAPSPVTRPDAGEGRRGSRRRHPEPTAAAAACPADAATTTNAGEIRTQTGAVPPTCAARMLGGTRRNLGAGTEAGREPPTPLENRHAARCDLTRGRCAPIGHVQRPRNPRGAWGAAAPPCTRRVARRQYWRRPLAEGDAGPERSAPCPR